MKSLDTFVPASDIWPDAEDCEDVGPIDGYMRGYCAEVVDRGGKRSWTRCVYTAGEPEDYFYDSYREGARRFMGIELTGRISFRGYFVEIPEFECR